MGPLGPVQILRPSGGVGEPEHGLRIPAEALPVIEAVVGGDVPVGVQGQERCQQPPGLGDAPVPGLPVHVEVEAVPQEDHLLLHEMDHPAVRGVVALHRQQPGREAPQVQRQPLGIDPAGRWDLDLPVIPRPLDGDVLPAELHLRALRHPGGDGGVRPGEGAHPAELPLRLPAGDHRKAGAHRPEAVVPVPVGQGDGGEVRDGQTRREQLPHVGGRVSAVDEE